MTPELMCELVMQRAALREAAFERLDGTLEAQYKYDRALRAWAMANAEYGEILRADIERIGA